MAGGMKRSGHILGDSDDSQMSRSEENPIAQSFDSDISSVNLGDEENDELFASGNEDDIMFDAESGTPPPLPSSSVGGEMSSFTQSINMRTSYQPNIDEQVADTMDLGSLNTIDATQQSIGGPTSPHQPVAFRAISKESDNKFDYSSVLHPSSSGIGAPGDWDSASETRVNHGYHNTVPAHTDSSKPILDEDATLTELEVSGMSLAEIVGEARFRRRISRDYQRFLTTYTNETGHSVYHARIRSMCAANAESLLVSYTHLVDANAFLAKLVANQPSACLEIFNEATMRVVLRLFEEYDLIRPAINVRISDLPTSDTLRDLRHGHLNTLVRVTGVVTRRSGVFPQLTLVKYDCRACGAILGPFVQDINDTKEIRVKVCSECQGKGPFAVNTSQTLYRNFQRLTLQEPPGSVPAGRLPRHKDVLLLADLIDAARPGEVVEVTGIYRNCFSYALNSKNGFPVFSTLIEANHVQTSFDEDTNIKHGNTYSGQNLTEEDIRDILRLSQDSDIGKRIIASIAPSIYGHQDVKTAIALALFGGQAKNAQGKHPIRGDINVLLLGDPGTAKSQFLKYVEKTASRAVYATGQGASAVGLTASVRKDPVTREWTLEGGALVLADKGVCLIDEFDKMNDSDRTSIHEAMEQQSISISKAGIVTTLQARASIIAAANPIRGRYQSSLPFSQNVQLTEPILSRFDILCVVRDNVDKAADERLARFVVGSHIRSHPAHDDDASVQKLADTLQTSRDYVAIEPIPQALLKKYISYAKATVRPELSRVDVDKIARLYADLRRESLATGSIPITVRHIESMVRMAEANARMHLRPQVRADDIDMAIRVALESFIQSQKYSAMAQLRRSFGKYCAFRKDHVELLMLALNDLLATKQRAFPDQPCQIPLIDLETRARELSIFDVKPLFSSRAFSDGGFRLLPCGTRITKD